MSAFTPGPWSQSHREGSNKMWSTEVYTQDGETICTLAWYPDGHGGTYREANARLIAAAPDLYEACKIVRDYLTKLENANGPDDPLRQIRRAVHEPLTMALDAAIAKARGVQ